MSDMLKYKGYTGSVEYSAKDQMLYGKVQGIRSLISYEGYSTHELIEDFQGAIDDYLIMCEEDGEIPEKPFKGTFNIRISPEAHEKAAILAISRHQTLNSFVKEAIEEKIAAM